MTAQALDSRGVSSVFRMPDGIRLGAPTLRVRSLQESLRFYQDDMGLRVLGSKKHSEDGLEIVRLGFATSKEPLLGLKHDPVAKRTPHDFAGMYHYAVLVPDRNSLASTYLAVSNSGAAFDGFADHTVSESLYLHDPERNGVELYADRRREEWSPFMELMKSGWSDNLVNWVSLNKALDFNSLIRELNNEERAKPLAFPKGGRIGHIHLRVTDLQRSVKFYHETLGFDIVGNLASLGAAFLSVGGYHHHIGLNTWHSRAGSPHREGEAGLDNFTIIVPESAVVTELAGQVPRANQRNGQLVISDPDGIRIIIET